MLNLTYNQEPDPIDLFEPTEPLRVAIYVRVSSDSQDINNSVEAQIAECEAFAKRYNFIVIKIYIDEAETGLASKRPQFQEMVYDTLSNEKPYDAILVWKFSRFSRDKLDNALYKNRLRKRGVRIISIKEAIDNSPAGQMMETMIEGMDAFYSANLSQDVRRGQRQLAARGYYPGNVPPYGYKIQKVQEEDGKAFHNIFVADEPYDQIVRRVILEAGAGKSANEIRAGLNQDGIPAPKGGKWADSTIHQMVHNLHYTGLIVWGVNSASGDPPVIAPGRHKPIVSDEEMQQAIQVFASKFHKLVNPRQTASEYMMSGLLICRLCGSPLTVRNNTTKGTAYYVCKARKEDGIAGCPLPYINIERFDKKFLEVTLDDILVPETVQGAIDHIASELSGPYEQQAATVLALEADIRKVKDQQDRVMAAYEAGAYTVTDFTKRMEPLRRTEADLETKRKEAERQLDQQAAIIAEPTMVLEFARQVAEFIKHSTPKQRKQVLKRFVKCVWIEPGKDKKEQARAKIMYRIPLPRDAGKSRNSERELALGEEPVSPSALLSPDKGTVEQPDKNVKQKSGLNRSILAQGWYGTRQKLEYKSDWYGRQFVPVPTHHTSQRCSERGHVDAGNRVSQAIFRCVSCGHPANADINAAENIRCQGLLILARAGDQPRRTAGGPRGQQAQYNPPQGGPALHA